MKWRPHTFNTNMSAWQLQRLAKNTKKNETDKIRQGRGLPEWQMPPLQIPQPSASLSRHHPSHPHHHTRHHHNTHHGLHHHHIDCHYGFNLSLAKNSWQSPWLLISTKNDSNDPGPAKCCQIGCLRFVCCCFSETFQRIFGSGLLSKFIWIIPFFLLFVSWVPLGFCIKKIITGHCRDLS